MTFPAMICWAESSLNFALESRPISLESLNLYQSGANDERLGVGIEANLWDDVNIFQLHARYYFE